MGKIILPRGVILSPALPGERDHVPPPPPTQKLLAWLRPYVRQSGDQLRARWHIRPRRLLDYLLVGIGDGEGDFTVGEERRQVGAGDLIWIPPGIQHEMRGTSPGMHCLYLHFDLCYDPDRSHWDACIPGGTDDLEPWQARMSPLPPDPVIAAWRGRLPVRDSGPALALMAEISLEHQRTGSTRALLLSALLQQLLAELLRQNDPAPAASNAIPAPHRHALREAAAVLRQPDDRRLDLGALAAKSRLSPAHFRRLFRANYGVNPRSFRQRHRIHRACELLVYSGQNVSQVAEALGFSCVQAFSRAFRQSTGISPRQYLTGSKGVRFH